MYHKKDVEDLGEFLIRTRQTLAVAESVTAGHLQAALSMATNASAFFQGGLTAYNLGQKVRHLNVEPIGAERCNCVSLPVVKEMALNVIRMFSSDWGIAIAGYATPSPEHEVREPFAWYAIAVEGKVLRSGKLQTKTRSGRSSQEYFTIEVLKKLRAVIRRRRGGTQTKKLAPGYRVW